MNAFFRSSGGLGKIYYSFSNNETNDIWYPPRPTHFENPNSGIDCVYTNDKRLFLVYNPSDKNRFPLVINELEDNMFTVIDEIVITEKIPEKEHTLTPELSYPYMIVNHGKLHLVYTWGRGKIEYCVISVD
jgi:predicted neuraminidase